MATARDAPNTTDSLRRLLESTTGETVDHLTFETQDRRLYSQIYRLDARVGGESRRYVVKSWANAETFAMQIRALDEARAVFGNDPDVCIPYLGCDWQARLLVMEYVGDDTLEALTRLEPSRDRLNIRAWRRRVDAACFSAGRWLRRWHDAHSGRADLGTLLGEYLHSRPGYLDLLDGDTRESLVQRVASLGSGPVAAVHGDFTPLNVLWAPERLTVLDFGINEWHQMTPAWDYETMRIGLLGELRFATRCPARWITGFADPPVAAFERGYGSMDVDPAVQTACSAIRHLILYAYDREAGPAHEKRAAWHRAMLQRLLDGPAAQAIS